MKKLFLILMLLLAACTSPAAEPAAPVTTNEEPAAVVDVPMEEHDDMMDEEMAEEPMDEMAEEEMMDEEMAEEPMDEMAEEEMMDEEMAEEPMEEMAEEEMMDEEMAEEPMGETAEETMMDLPAWQTLSLTNARTAETFTLANFAGKTVFVEPMATWCSNCRQQLQTVQSLQGQVGDDVVFVALSVETTISAAELATYAQNQGFDFHFAVMTPEFLQALAAEFGQTIANPPATPHFVINPDGSFTSLSTGIETADELLAKIQG